MGMEERGTASTSVLTPWRRYRRRTDNSTVSGRLVKKDGKTLMEVKESKMPNFCCPNCKYPITQGNSGAFPNFFLETQIFHENHRPLD